MSLTFDPVPPKSFCGTFEGPNNIAVFNSLFFLGWPAFYKLEPKLLGLSDSP